MSEAKRTEDNFHRKVKEWIYNVGTRNVKMIGQKLQTSMKSEIVKRGRIASGKLAGSKFYEIDYGKNVIILRLRFEDAVRYGLVATSELEGSDYASKVAKGVDYIPPRRVAAWMAFKPAFAKLSTGDFARTAFAIATSIAGAGVKSSKFKFMGSRFDVDLQKRISNYPKTYKRTILDEVLFQNKKYITGVVIPRGRKLKRR